MRPPGPNCGRAPGPSCEPRRAMVWGAPPLGDCTTMSYHSLRAQSRPRRVAPEPREYASAAPSGFHDGFRYSPGSFVSCCGAPPEDETVQSWPCLSSFQLAKAIVLPLGDHAGENSPGMNESGVRRLGLPLGRSMSQSLSTAWNTSCLPSGEALCQRINLASNASSRKGSGDQAISEIVRCTRAVKDTVSTFPFSTQSLRIFPPWEISIDFPSALQTIPGSIVICRELSSDSSNSIRSMSIRSSPVCKSRSQCEVRAPKTCPL